MSKTGCSSTLFGAEASISQVTSPEKIRRLLLQALAWARRSDRSPVVRSDGGRRVREAEDAEHRAA